ncbi:hypothetical protein [Blastococcus mobilis]|uniref:Uncharacterized protein n=1 Tax=Blastococcus mobilis TaxID=1938746 RepID=A0A238VH94_9ACTN|nr:hypothetical protein [Blastococcus mobilis]SNR32879.1 hypothetical protein SAMN06272737_10363 [Blastococcus mobilis]
MNVGTCGCDTRETHPASECVAPWESPEDVMQNDVRALLLAVGLSPHARPYSPHAVIHRELLPALHSLPLPECPTHAVCPNCREGRGHWNGERYEPTEQSREANR